MRRTTIGLVLAVTAAVLPGLMTVRAAADDDVLGPGDVVHTLPALDGATRQGLPLRDGDRVVAMWRVDGVTRLRQTAADGSGPWTAVPGLEASSATTLLAASAGVTAVQGWDSAAEQVVTVSGPRGQWTVPGRTARLDDTGTLVIVDGVVRDTVSGNELARYPTDTRSALDGGAWWTWDLVTSTLVSQRPGTDAVTSDVILPPCWGAATFQVRGRWVLAGCPDVGVRVFDREGVFTPLHLPDSATNAVLGAHTVSAFYDDALRVLELAGEGPVRVLHQRSWSVDRTSDALVTVSADSSLRAVDLTPTADATHDATPPTAALVPLPEYFPAAKPPRLTWTAADTGALG